MTKLKYVRPTLTSMGLPIKRAQGFDIEGYCNNGGGAGAPGGICDSGLTPQGDIPDNCASGDNATLDCSSGSLGGLGIDDACEDGNTIYGGAPCSTGTNQS